MFSAICVQHVYRALIYCTITLCCNFNLQLSGMLSDAYARPVYNSLRARYLFNIHVFLYDRNLINSYMLIDGKS